MSCCSLEALSRQCDKGRNKDTTSSCSDCRFPQNDYMTLDRGGFIDSGTRLLPRLARHPVTETRRRRKRRRRRRRRRDGTVTTVSLSCR